MKTLEEMLGDPFDADAPLSFRRGVGHDERGEFPDIDILREWGFHEWFVPRRFGGRLTSYEALLDLVRSVARRDLTIAIAYGTALLGANPIWLWGSSAQRERLAAMILEGEFGSFAMSEAAHGSDLLATEMTAAKDGAGYRLNGEKWPIGNATRGRFVTALARTTPAGGARGFSLLFVDKRGLKGWSALPKAKTLGGRGHDLSGLRFEDCAVGADALIGREGLGVELALKALQLTRTLIAGLSLGAAESALRIALRWSMERRLYGKPICELPPVRELLAGMFVDLSICEAMTVSAARAISVAGDRMSLWSSVVKYFVPVTAENIFRDAAVVLGARHYLREGVAEGAFQKLLRDHAIASVFEGTTLVNLHLIAAQLPSLVDDGDEELLRRLRQGPAPEWNPEEARLSLVNHGRDEITASLAGDPIWDGERARLKKDVSAILKKQRHLYESAAGFSLAKRHCLLHAAACARHLPSVNARLRGEPLSESDVDERFAELCQKML